MSQCKPMFVLQTYEDRLAGMELSQKLSERLINLSMKDNHGDDGIRENGKDGVPPPPPPPPNLDDSQESVSSSRSSTLKPNKTKSKAPPVPVKYSTLSYNKPPPCPTPDYDTLSIASTTSHTTSKPSQNNNNNNDTVEMESLESFKINNPTNLKPKPPNTYFPKSIPNGNTNTIRKKERPVSITIGEYPTLRKQPGKLDFLQNRSSPDDVPNGNTTPITSQLASELAQTLNRSHLRKRTESMENLLSCNNNHIKPQSNGSVRISLNSSLARNLAKSTNDLSNLINNDHQTLSNRVTINVNLQDKKPETHNGILKNHNSSSVFSANSHKPLVQQKSITFGELPTVIKDTPLRVT